MIRRGVYQLELVAALTLIGGVCLSFLLAVWSMNQRAADDSDWKQALPTIGGVSSKSKRKAESIHYVGIAAGGCAAANCHGGVRSLDDSGQPKPGDEWKTSAFDFLQHDPHAQAYNVLFEERSRIMIDRLASGDEAVATGKITPPGDRTDVLWYAAQLQTRCVSCHATPLPAAAANTTRGTLNDYALGVTCEACHGAASQWGDQHLSARWQTNSSAEIENPIDKKATGFHELEDPSTAAATCAKCHIGDGSQVDGMSYREVTHDLIAAGHPRLDFDFAAWYASMPPHWNREREKQTDFNTHAWWVGQDAALDTRENLIAARVRAGASEKETGAFPQRPWPELAYFDCYACHQALRFPSSNGVEPYFAASTSDGKHSIFEVTLPFGSFWKVYGHLNTDVKAKNQAMSDLLFLKRRTGEVISGMNIPAPSQFADRLASFPEGNNPLRCFDELLSWYYAADAVSRDAAFAAQSSPDLQSSATTLETSLQQLKSEMEKYLARSGEVSRYASPSGFGAVKVEADDTEKPDPQAVQTAFEEAKQALSALAAKWSP